MNQSWDLATGNGIFGTKANFYFFCDQNKIHSCKFGEINHASRRYNWDKGKNACAPGHCYFDLISKTLSLIYPNNKLQVNVYSKDLKIT